MQETDNVKLKANNTCCALHLQSLGSPQNNIMLPNVLKREKRSRMEMGPTDERTTGVFQHVMKMIPTIRVSRAPRAVNTSITILKGFSHIRKTVAFFVQLVSPALEYSVILLQGWQSVESANRGQMLNHNHQVEPDKAIGPEKKQFFVIMSLILISIYNKAMWQTFTLIHTDGVGKGVQRTGLALIATRRLAVSTFLPMAWLTAFWALGSHSFLWRKGSQLQSCIVFICNQGNQQNGMHEGYTSPTLWSLKWLMLHGVQVGQLHPQEIQNNSKITWQWKTNTYRQIV